MKNVFLVSIVFCLVLLGGCPQQSVKDDSVFNPPSDQRSRADKTVDELDREIDKNSQ